MGLLNKLNRKTDGDKKMVKTKTWRKKGEGKGKGKENRSNVASLDFENITLSNLETSPFNPMMMGSD